MNQVTAGSCVITGFYCLDPLDNMCKSLDYLSTRFGREIVTGKCLSDSQTNAVKCSPGPVCLDIPAGKICRLIDND